MMGPSLASPRPLTDPYHAPSYYQSGRQPFAHLPAAFSDLKQYTITNGIYRTTDNPCPVLIPPPGAYLPGNIMSPSSTQKHQIRSQEGPPFGKTEVVNNVVTGQSHPVSPEIGAAIQKGFFQVDGKWTCYRRNYFTVACSFHVKSPSADGRYYVQRQGRSDLVARFAVSISAKTASMNNQESEPRGLVQHTPKRDKATESVPGKQIIQPMAPNGGVDSYGLNPHSYPLSHPVQPPPMNYYDRNSGPQSPTPPTSHTFERIQFQKATANNGKRRAQQQYFHVVVELSAEIGSVGSEQWITVAKRQSDQMVVRGRSPGHYKDANRRDSSAGMGPDSGAGSGGDATGNHLPIGSIISGHSQSSTMDWSSTHRNGHQYGGSTYGCRPGVSYSPDSGSSATCFTGTPTESGSEPVEGGSDTPGRDLLMDGTLHDYTFQDGDASSITNDSDYFLSPEKRPTEMDMFSCSNSYSSAHSTTEGFSDSSMDFMVCSHPKAVCAS